ncbi:MAG: glycosyltransferase [Microgenomates group bacterium]
MKKKVLVLTDNMPWGHRAIARAIYGYLGQQKSVNVEYVEVKMPLSVVNEIYTLMYRYLPSGNRFYHKLMEVEALRKLFFDVLDQSGTKYLEKVVKTMNPEVIVSSYFFLSHGLIALRKTGGYRYKLMTVVADPWTINPITFVPEADVNFVYDEVGVKEGLKYKIERKRLVKTGWWVREEMYKKQLTVNSDQLTVKSELGIGDERPVVFIGGGSLGTNSILKLLPSLLLVKKKVAIIFNTGTDTLLKNTIDQYKMLIKTLKRDSLVQIINLGWIDNMAKILSISDIVMGKAGPNFLFDVVAIGKPFVAITHIGGQEDGNIEIIKKKKLGWVREKGNSAARFFLKFVENPEKYKNKFKTTIAAEAKNNRGGLERVWSEIENNF